MARLTIPAAVRAARELDRLLSGARCCATPGCERTPLKDEEHCGCCLDDRRHGRIVLARAADVPAPAGPSAPPPPAMRLRQSPRQHEASRCGGLRSADRRRHSATAEARRWNGYVARVHSQTADPARRHRAWLASLDARRRPRPGRAAAPLYRM